MENITITIILPYTVLPPKEVTISVPPNAKGPAVMTWLSQAGHIGGAGSTYVLVRRKLHDRDVVQVFLVDEKVSGTQTVPEAEAEMYYFGSAAEAN